MFIAICGSARVNNNGGIPERRQFRVLPKHIARNGLTLADRSFADKGVSGWKGKNREGALGDILKVLQEGDDLLVEDLDRLSRENPLSAMNLLQSIVLKGVTVVSLRDNNTVTKENFYSLPTFLPSILKASLL